MAVDIGPGGLCAEMARKIDVCRATNLTNGFQIDY